MRTLDRMNNDLADRNQELEAIVHDRDLELRDL